jgi:hypothetical protein
MALNIPKLQYNLPLALPSGIPTQTFQRWWQEVADNIELNVNDLAAAVADIQTLQTQMNDRITEIAAIQADLSDQLAQIQAAQAAADVATRNDAISASATAPSSILSASDAGSDATISIAGHDRIYGDGSVVTIDPSSITGLAYSTLYAVYYDDVNRTGGAKTFVATTVLKDAQYNKVAGRHFCGQVTTPAAGGGSTSGGPGIPGGGGPYP